MEVTLALPAANVAVATPLSTAPDGLAEVSQTDASRFRALLTGEVAPATAGDNAQSLAALDGPATATGGALGDMILRSLGDVRDRIQTAYSGIDAMVAPNAAPPTVGDVLALQYRLMQVSVEYELVAKVVSKSAQNLEQLVKVQ
jgi:type III secretion protein I